MYAYSIPHRTRRLPKLIMRIKRNITKILNRERPDNLLKPEKAKRTKKEQFLFKVNKTVVINK